MGRMPLDQFRDAIKEERDKTPEIMGQVTWNATPAGVREVVMQGAVGAPDYLNVLPRELVTDQMRLVQPSEREVANILAMAQEAVLAGRLVDFGYLPNAVMSWGGQRGGPLFQQKVLGQPFSDPWLMLHSWEQGSCLYLINPCPKGMEIVELQALKLDDADRLFCIGDRGLFMNDQPTSKKYHCAILPSPLRYLGLDEMRRHVNSNLHDGTGDDPLSAGAGNIGDPVATGLLILATRAVPRATVEADPKLQRARARNGKPPLPSYDTVDTKDYVTAILKRGIKRSEDQGGTHRSPVPHIRMGHPRDYATGRSIWIQDTLVGVPEEKRVAWKRGLAGAGRTHYTVRP